MDTDHGSTYGRTDTQNFTGLNIMPLQLFVVGHTNVVGT